METRETRNRLDYVKLALSVHGGDAAEAAATCRLAAEWWSTVHQDTAARWQRVADELLAMVTQKQDKELDK